MHLDVNVLARGCSRKSESVREAREEQPHARPAPQKARLRFPSRPRILTTPMLAAQRSRLLSLVLFTTILLVVLITHWEPGSLIT